MVGRTTRTVTSVLMTASDALQLSMNDVGDALELEESELEHMEVTCPQTCTETERAHDVLCAPTCDIP